MFLSERYSIVAPPSFPRVRGDVPKYVFVGAGGAGFSPRARGCSADWVTAAVQLGVFPAYAGMFRIWMLWFV